MIKELAKELLNEARKPHRPSNETIQEVVLSGK